MTEISKEGWNSKNPQTWDMDEPKNAGTHALHGQKFRSDEAAGHALMGAGAKKVKVHDFDGYEHPQHGLFGTSGGKIYHYGSVTKMDVQKADYSKPGSHPLHSQGFTYRSDAEDALKNHGFRKSTRSISGRPSEDVSVYEHPTHGKMVFHYSKPTKRSWFEHLGVQKSHDAILQKMWEEIKDIKKGDAGKKIHPGWNKILSSAKNAGLHEGHAHVAHKTLSGIDSGMNHKDAFKSAAEDENYHGHRPDIVRERERVRNHINSTYKTNIPELGPDDI